MKTRHLSKGGKFVIICLILVIVVLFILTINNNKTRINKITINSSIHRSQEFLKQEYFKDYSQNFTYPSLYVPNYDPKEYSVSMCVDSISTCLYKKMDLAIMLLFFRDSSDTEAIEDIVSDSENFLATLLSKWQQAEVDYSYMSSQLPKGEVAFDLYCILGDVFDDKEIQRNMLESFDGLEWVNLTIEQVGFRKITDEYWSFKLVVEELDDRSIKSHLDQKLGETFELIDNKYIIPDNIDADKQVFNAIIHTLLAFAEARDNGFDISPYNKDIEELEDKLIEITFIKLNSDSTEIVANSLYALSRIESDNYKVTHKLAQKLIKNQNNDGSWSIYLNDLIDIQKTRNMDSVFKSRSKVFLTIRVDLALEEFRKVYLENEKE